MRATSAGVWSFRDITRRKRAEEALRDETRILELLNQTGTTLASKLDLQALVQAVTDAATQLSGAQFGAFFYNIDRRRRRRVHAVHALRRAARGVREVRAAARHRALRPDLPRRGRDPLRRRHCKDPRYGKMAPHHGMPPGHLPVRSYLAVPVVSRSGEVIGGLFFGHPEPGIFTERAERIVVGRRGAGRGRDRQRAPLRSGAEGRRGAQASCSRASAPRAPRPSA